MDPNQVDAKGWTPLHHAAKAGKSNEIRLLLEAGANPHVLTSSGDSPLDLVRKFAPDHTDASTRLEAAAAGTSEVLPEKDEDRHHIVPTAWRPRIVKIVDAFARGDYALSRGIEGVTFDASDADSIEYNVAGYGEPLVALPDEAWNTSFVQWTGERWDAQIDLWTISGCSDLVLFLKVHETPTGHEIEVYLVYVP